MKHAEKYLYPEDSEIIALYWERSETAIRETERRRGIQQAYNEANGIVPTTITKDVRDIIEISGTSKENKKVTKTQFDRMTKQERMQLIAELTKEMKNAAKLLEFEHAAYLRDRIKQLQE